MTNLTPTPNTDAQPADKQETQPSLLQYLTGSLISGGCAIALYLLTSSIAHAFANKPVSSTNQTAIRITLAVRTLVVGLSTLATTLFTIIGLGLMAAAIYVSVQKLKNRQASPSDTR